MSRASLEKQGYLPKSFPNLVGCVASTLEGNDREIMISASKDDEGGSWTEDLKPADLVLAPAACYPVYPIAAARGVVPDTMGMFSMSPAIASGMSRPKSLDRFQTFRMREYVRIGTPEQIQSFREPWITRAQGIASTAIGSFLQG